MLHIKYSTISLSYFHRTEWEEKKSIQTGFWNKHIFLNCIYAVSGKISILEVYPFQGSKNFRNIFHLPL